jgi:hypothetical protein
MFDMGSGEFFFWKLFDPTHQFWHSALTSLAVRDELAKFKHLKVQDAGHSFNKLGEPSFALQITWRPARPLPASDGEGRSPPHKSSELHLRSPRARRH